MSSFIYGNMSVYQYLVVSFVLQGLNGTVTYIGTYDTFVGTCNLTGNISTIYQLTSAALSKSNFSSTWLPIRRHHLSGWYWLSGAYYNTVLCTDHKYNMMCGVLRAADKLLDCAECNRTYTKFLCQTRGVASNCGQKCLHVRGESFILYNRSGTWYDAKRLCMKENQQLASIDRETSRELLEKLHEKNKLYSDIWVGLREVDYFWHQENKSVFEYNWRQTDPCPCNTENECVILVTYSTNKPFWKPENCSSSINFTCPREEAPIKIPAGDETITGVPYNATTELVIVPVSTSIIPILLSILISLTIIIVLIILLLYCILKKRKISKRKEAEGLTNNLELGSMMRNQPHNIPSDTEPEEVPVSSGTTPSVNGVAPNQTGSPTNLDSKDNDAGNIPSCKEQKPPHDDSSVAPHRSFPEPDTGVNEEEPSETEPLLQRRAPEADQHPPRDTTTDGSLPKSEDFPEFGPMPLTADSRPAHPTESQEPRGSSEPSSLPENLAPET